MTDSPAAGWPRTIAKTATRIAVGEEGFRVIMLTWRMKNFFPDELARNCGHRDGVGGELGIGELASLVGALANESVSGKKGAGSQLSVVSTTGMIGDAVHRIGGDRVKSSVLMGAGIDPHSYRQTRSDIVRIHRADLVFRNGLHLEAQMADLFSAIEAKQPGKRCITLGDHLPLASLLRSQSGTGPVRSAYLDGSGGLVSCRCRGSESVDGSRSGWCGVVSGQCATLSGQHSTHLANSVRAKLAPIPKQRRILVTAPRCFRLFRACLRR